MFFVMVVLWDKHLGERISGRDVDAEYELWDFMQLEL